MRGTLKTMRIRLAAPSSIALLALVAGTGAAAAQAPKPVTLLNEIGRAHV